MVRIETLARTRIFAPPPQLSDWLCGLPILLYNWLKGKDKEAIPVTGCGAHRVVKQQGSHII
jgi:hypothetical protein